MRCQIKTEALEKPQPRENNNKEKRETNQNTKTNIQPLINKCIEQEPSLIRRAFTNQWARARVSLRAYILPSHILYLQNHNYKPKYFSFVLLFFSSSGCVFVFLGLGLGARELGMFWWTAQGVGSRYALLSSCFVWRLFSL